MLRPKAAKTGGKESESHVLGALVDSPDASDLEDAVLARHDRAVRIARVVVHRHRREQA